MLASITPLGEWARNSRWSTTVAFYLVGSTVGGVAFGAALGMLGAAILSERAGVALAVLAAVLAVGVAFDLRLLGLRLPTVHRQVKQVWLDRYRSWIYGLGFGVQLGVGVVTVVSSSTVYATFFASFLTGSWKEGAVIGAVFGALRAGTLFSVARVRTPEQLDALGPLLSRWEPRSRYATAAAQGVLVTAIVAAMI